MKIDELIRRIFFRLRGRVISLKPRGVSKGNALISYITLPYLNRSERTLNAHSNRWESMDMANSFLEHGYVVDLIDITNTSFIPKKRYDFFIDNGTNMDRLAPMLGENCKKIFHATTAHWKFNNEAEQKRFNDLLSRRGVRLQPDRIIPPNRAAELCDEITLLGNQFTEGTYAFAGKKITRIPISTTHTFDSPEQKDFEQARKNFLWFGGAGVIHKGLDLVVEAFAQMPDYTLTICGKLDGEKEFLELYKKELSLPNIKVVGFVDPESEEFKRIMGKSIAIVYPSCAEGGGGSVILCVYAGLIPLVSYESSVEVEDFGVIFSKNSIDEIKKEVKKLSTSEIDTLKEKAVRAWKHVQLFHTREIFAQNYRAFLENFK